MSNLIARLHYTIDVSEKKAEALVGRPDDGSNEWYREAAEAVEAAVTGDPVRFLENAADDPYVEIS